MDVEGQAEVIGQYGAQILPGLPQTEDYARAFFRALPGLTSEKREERVAARTARQEQRRSEPPPFHCTIVDESAFRRPVGSRECMHNRLASPLAH
ncbi:Scr1 family TA system antitoxin-like transcriptional regulator [Streptomyces sp. NPDC056244]|uniref:Scr1 family TA system antitoxin-like transcriptional regulator n=1 Tax=unclassified Streptomyces TaxID=2593676 RepID=UPI0035DF49E5